MSRSRTYARLARGTLWGARLIGIGGTALQLLQGCGGMIFSEGQDSGAVARFSLIAAGIALTGCSFSFWRRFLAGLVLLGSWLASLQLVDHVIGLKHYYYVNDYRNAGYPLLAAGLLFLISWWFSRQPRSEASK